MTAPELDLALQGVSETVKTILVDTSELQYISSAGLRVFLALAKKSKQNECSLAIHSLQDSVLRVFEVSGFNKILSLHSDESSALELVAKA